MTPSKWYEDIWISLVFTPLRWRLRVTWEPQWRQAGVDIGPIMASVGWPEIAAKHPQQQS